MPRHIGLLAGALLLSAPLVAAEPALDPEGLLIYMPTIGAAVGIGGAYLLLAAVHFFHIFRSGAKWGLCLPIGGLFAALGWLLRLPVRTNQRSTPLYAVQQLFIVLSPAAFLAFNYVSGQRNGERCGACTRPLAQATHARLTLSAPLARSSTAASSSPSTSRLTWAARSGSAPNFHLFRRASSGASSSGAMSLPFWCSVPAAACRPPTCTRPAPRCVPRLPTCAPWPRHPWRSHNLAQIFLVGVILQGEQIAVLQHTAALPLLLLTRTPGVSYLIFTVLSLTAHFRLRRLDRVFAFRNLCAAHPTLRLLLAIYVASVLILVRSVFRIVEASEGYGGPVSSSRAPRYALR